VSLAAIEWQAVGSLVLAALAIMGTPGPATISLTAAGSAFGVRRSTRYLAGIIVGTTIVLVAVATGITAALLAVPAARPALTAISVIYILRLAYLVATAPPLTAQGAGGQPPTLSGGVLLGVANPKAWVAIAAVFAGARVSGGPATDGIAKVVVLVILIVLINATWLVAGASFAPALRDPRRARVINVVLAVVLVGAMAFAIGE
jgi:threonine/homoserine/homoserine lactone efflux protein